LTAAALPCRGEGGGPGSSGLSALVRLLGQSDDPAVQADVLRGTYDALNGRRKVAMPAEWPGVYRRLAVSPNAEVREKARLLAVLFNDHEALAAMRRLARDSAAAPAERLTALQALVSARNPDLVPLLKDLLTDNALRGAAVRGLAAYDDPATPQLLLEHYASFTDEEKADAVHTLASRPAYALALLAALERGRVPRRDLTAFTVRQMLALKDGRVTARVNQVWGVLRPASQEKAAETKRLKQLLTPAALRAADRAHGRLVYAKHCAACHVLFGEGGKVGPELTGGQRANLDYVLENLLDPSAVVGRDYQVTLVQTKDGRLVTGIVTQETDRVLTLQTQNEVVRVPKEDVEERQQSNVSMMPEGLLAKLAPEEVRDLVAYLAGPAQVPLPAGRPGAAP
jgi:putative heme-binding domain-containing protein